MATHEAPNGAAFTNPVLVARLTMVRLLQVVDELERAAARQDPWSVARLARLAHEKLTEAEAAVGRVVTDLERDMATVAEALADPTDKPAEAPVDVWAEQGALDELVARERRADAWADRMDSAQTEAEARAAWGDR